MIIDTIKITFVAHYYILHVFWQIFKFIINLFYAAIWGSWCRMQCRKIDMYAYLWGHSTNMLPNIDHLPPFSGNLWTIFWIPTLFDRKLHFTHNPRNSFVVVVRKFFRFAQFLEYFVMQSICIISYHFKMSLDMFAEAYQIVSFQDKSRHVCRIVSNRIILGQVLICLLNPVKSHHT